jgi:hypothetical protein
MNKCKKTRSLFLEYFYGELKAPKKKIFEDHIEVCKNCRSEFEDMKAVLQFTGKRIRPEPPKEFWDTYGEKLERKIELEEDSLKDREPLWEKLGKRLNIVPKWAYQAAAAVTILIIGVFIGRGLFSPVPSGTQHASLQSELAAPQQPEATLVSRSQDYIERSKLILLALVNFDPAVEDPYALDLPYQKQVSRELVTEAGFLKNELAESDQERLEALIANLEMILLQIANLETESDFEAIELVKDGIDRQGILMEINLTDLRLSMKKRERPTPIEQPSRKPKTI